MSQGDRKMPSNPFRGLASYAEGDSLFEREADVDLVKGRLWSSRFTVLFAGSGVGKTSFLRAKLITALKEILGNSNVAMPDSWADGDSVGALRAFRVAKPNQDAQQGPSILILDQFEEVFQSFPNVALLNSLGRELAAFSDKSAAIDTRILLSVREEFLAELSSFEDFMPGLFTNYYRLERPTVGQAKTIIVRTARLVNVDVSSKVDTLLEDLRQVKSKKAPTSNVIDPPYLQIVCHRIWDREQPNADKQFLQSYSVGQAEIELEQYTREKLKHLHWREKVLLSKAVGHLTGPHEAKRYMRLSDISREVGMRNTRLLKRTLDPLCAEQVRILKGKNDTYGLYHDMYAPMLWNWREEQVRAQQRRKSISVFIIGLAISFFVIYPLLEWWGVRQRLGKPEYGNIDEYSNVLDMRNALSYTLVWKLAGDHMWKTYNEKLSTLAAFKMDNDAAVLHRVAAASVMGRLTDIAPINSLLKPEQYLLATLDANSSDIVADAVLHENGLGKADYVLEGTVGGRFIRIPFTETNVGSVDPQPVDVKVPIGKNNADGSRPSAPQVKLLCLAPGGGEGLVAWLSALPTATTLSTTKIGVNKIKFVAHLAEFSTQSGQQIRPDAIDLPSDVFTLTPEQRDTSTPRQTVVSPLDTQVPPDVVSVFEAMQATFSTSGKQVAVIASGTAFIFDVENGALTNERKLPVERVTRVGFASDGVVALAYKPDKERNNAPIVDENVELCDLLMQARAHCVSLRRSPTLPSEARFVFRSDGSALLKFGLHWGWANLSTVDIPDEEWVIPPSNTQGFAPQAFNERADILLAKDYQQRLYLLPSKNAQSDATLLPSTEPRAQAESRILTAAAVRRFGTAGMFVSLDNNGRLVRLWATPAILVDQPILELPSQPGRDMPPIVCTKQCIYESLDGEWSAVVSDGKLAIKGVKQNINGWSTNGLPSVEPSAIRLSTTGKRALIWYKSEIVYAAQESPMRCYKSGQVLAGALGPGDDRVTLLTSDKVSIHKPLSSWPQCASTTVGNIPIAEWDASITGVRTKLLDNTSDENGVVLYSGRWAHRITAGDESWPKVKTLFSDVVLDRLEPRKINSSRVLRIVGTNSDISFDEDVRSNKTANSFLAFWRSPLTLKMCGSSDKRGLGLGLTEDELKQAGVSWQDEVNRFDWREVLCQTESRTDRQTGTGAVR
jgi:hypothetical protein